MIFFEDIFWQNLLSTGQTGTTIDLHSDSTVLLIGINGAGKSTFLDALCFNLYGCAFRSINKNQLINTVNKKKLLTVSNFRIDGKHYKVVRGIKPNIFEIWIDGVKRDDDADVRITQSILENQILKLNYQTFTQIIVLGSVDYTPFMLLPLGKRREIIENLLDISVFTDMNEILKNIIKDLNKEHAELNRVYQLASQSLDLKRGFLANQKEQISQKINALNIEHQTVTSNLNAALVELSQIMTDIEALNYPAIQQQYDDLNAKITNANTEITSRKNLIAELQNIIIENDKAIADNEVATTKYTEEVSTLQKQYDAFVIPADIDAEIQRMEGEFRKYSDINADLTAERKVLVSKGPIQYTDDDLKSHTESLDNARIELTSIGDISVIRTDIKSINNSIQQLNIDHAVLNADIANGDKEIAFLSENDSCESCGQQIHDDFRKQRMADLETKKADAMDRHDANEQEMTEISLRLIDLTQRDERYVALTETIREFEVTLREIVESLDRGKQIAVLDGLIAENAPVVDLWKTRVDTCKQLKTDCGDALTALNAAKTALVNAETALLSAKTQTENNKVRIKTVAGEIVSYGETAQQLVNDRVKLGFDELSESYKAKTTKANEINTGIGFMQQSIIRIDGELVVLNNSTEIKAMEDEIETLNADFTKQGVVIDVLADDIENHTIVAGLLKDDGIKTNIVRYYLPFINTTLNQYMEKFEFPVSFMFNENFEETIKSRYRDDFGFNSFSEGEKARINLALMFTWWKIAMMKNRNACNILIFDEVFDGSMDGNGGDCFMSIIDEVKATSNVLVISHKEAMATAGFDRILVAKKVGDFSHLYDNTELEEELV